MDLIDTKRTNVDELNSRIQQFQYGYLFKKDKLKIIKSDEIKHLSIPTKASQVLTFYKLAPFILENIIDPYSENFWAFKCMRKIVLYTFSKKLTEESLESLQAAISDFFIEWNHSYEELHGFKPNHHFLTHLVDDIKLFGHPTEFSSMRYEGKHQQFKIISKKNQGFKDHQQTIIHTFIGAQNLKLKMRNFLKQPENMKLKQSDLVCVYHDDIYILISKCTRRQFNGKKVILSEFDDNMLCYKIEISKNEVNGVLSDTPCLMQIVKDHNGNYFLMKDVDW